MASRRLLICTAIVAALNDVPGLTARWLFDGEDDESGVQSTTPQAIVVPGSDTVASNENVVLARELVGHVIFSTHAGGPFDDARRAIVDEQMTSVEQALMMLGVDTANNMGLPGIPLARVVPGVTEFDVAQIFDTIIDSAGRFNARIDWICRYRHDATDPRSYRFA